MTHPTCFDTDEQFVLWLQVDRYMHNHQGTISLVCEDCNPLFAEKMRTEGRCDHPEVVFIQSTKHGMMGVIPPRDGYIANYRNVTWDKKKMMWMTYAQRENKRIIIGYFDDQDEAAQARDEWIKQYNREHA